MIVFFLPLRMKFHTSIQYLVPFLPRVPYRRSGSRPSKRMGRTWRRLLRITLLINRSPLPPMAPGSHGYTELKAGTSVPRRTILLLLYIPCLSHPLLWHLALTLTHTRTHHTHTRHHTLHHPVAPHPSYLIPHLPWLIQLHQWPCRLRLRAWIIISTELLWWRDFKASLAKSRQFEVSNSSDGIVLVNFLYVCMCIYIFHKFVYWMIWLPYKNWSI